MIVRVVPAIRFPRTARFDYAAPGGAAIPELGAIVRVPFSGRKVVGVVWDIAETADVPSRMIKTFLEAFWEGRPVLGLELRTVLERLAVHLQVPLPLLLLHLLPRFPAHVPAAAPAIGARGEGWRSEVLQVPSLFDGDTLAARLLPMLAANPSLVLAPTVAHTRWLADFLATRGIEPAVFDASATPAAAARAWISLAAGSSHTLVATRSGVCAPLPADGRIVLFAEEEPSFRQFDAEPRYDARHLARVRARTETRPLAAVSEAPTLAAVFSATGAPSLLAPGDAPRIISLEDERRAGLRGILSDAALSAATAAIEQGKDVLVCVNRKGDAMRLRCVDCGDPVRCPDCGIAARVYGRTLRCPRCGAERPAPEACAVCTGVRLRPGGVTVGSTAAELRRRLPGTAIQEVDVRTDLAPRPSPTVHVGTEMLLHSLRPSVENLSLGAVIAPAAEQLLGIGDFADAEEGYARLRALQAVAARRNAPLLLQTNDARHPTLAALMKPAAAFYAAELAERAEFLYPPTATLVTIAVPSGTPASQVRDAVLPLVPTDARLDENGKDGYTLRFKASDELLPASFARLPPSWRMRADPRTLAEAPAGRPRRAT